MKYLFLLLFFINATAQRFDILSGDFKALGDIAEYNVIFDYEGMAIHGYESQEAFLKDKTEKRSAEKAEKFANAWFADRSEKYEPRFIAYFNSRFEDGRVKTGKDPQAQYTMLVRTTWLYPGYGIGMGGEPAKISAIVTVFETANPSNVKLSVAFDKSIGFENKNYNEPGDRIFRRL